MPALNRLSVFDEVYGLSDVRASEWPFKQDETYFDEGLGRDSNAVRD